MKRLAIIVAAIAAAAILGATSALADGNTTTTGPHDTTVTHGTVTLIYPPGTPLPKPRPPEPPMVPATPRYTG